jgi:hypothetical protein
MGCQTALFDIVSYQTLRICNILERRIGSPNIYLIHGLCRCSNSQICDMVVPSPWVGKQQNIFNHGTKFSQVSSEHDKWFHHQCEGTEHNAILYSS